MSGRKTYPRQPSVMVAWYLVIMELEAATQAR